MDKDKIYKSYADHYGKFPQVDKLLEEMAELAVELLKDRAGRESNVLEELADVQNVLNQLIPQYDPDSKGRTFENILDKKIQRMGDRITWNIKNS